MATGGSSLRRPSRLVTEVDATGVGVWFGQPDADRLFAGASDTGGRRVLTILRYLARCERPVLASAIARDCQVPRSSVYRLLHVMEEERFVAYYPDEGCWGLGLSSYALGTGQALSDGLDRNSTSLLAALAVRTGGFVGLGVLDGTDAVVSRVHRPTSWAGFEPGLRYPAHLTALGRALLIDASRDDLLALYGDRRLARPTGMGPGTVDELLGLLRDAALRGFTESPAELADGIWAYATPIRNAAGRVVAALSAGFLGGPPTNASRDRAVAGLLAGAAEISSRLGYRPRDRVSTSRMRKFDPLPEIATRLPGTSRSELTSKPSFSAPC